jgi:hypothetical protein
LRLRWRRNDVVWVKFGIWSVISGVRDRVFFGFGIGDLSLRRLIFNTAHVVFFLGYGGRGSDSEFQNTTC